MPRFSLFLFSLLVLVPLLVASELIAESQVRSQKNYVPRSFSGGSALADPVALPNSPSEASADSGKDMRAMPKLSNSELKKKLAPATQPKLIRRSNSGGSAMSDYIAIKP